MLNLSACVNSGTAHKTDRNNQKEKEEKKLSCVRCQMSRPSKWHKFYTIMISVKKYLTPTS